MKLGYYYTVTAGGAGSKEIRINEGDWTSVVDDERRLWQKYAVKGQCLAMTYTEDGLVLVVVKVLGGSRPDNNVSTWIHIPSKAKITGRQIEQIVEEIQKLYLNGTKDVTEASFKSNPILGQDFDEKRYGLRVKSASGNKIAYRSGASDWSISEILDKPFQEYYHNYKFVFLYKENPIDKEGLTDLSSQEILDMTTVLPPSIDSIRNLFGYGDVMIDVDNQKFTYPILRKKGSQLLLTARRSGFLPINFYAQVMNDEQEPEYLSVSDCWRKILGGVTVDVRDEKTNRLINAKVGILDSEWDVNTQSLPENRLQDVRVKVTAEGYETEERYVDFTRPISPIYLKRLEEKKEYSYRTKDGRKLKILIVGEGASSTHPIDGYTASNDKLIYKGEKYNYDVPDFCSLYSDKSKKAKRFWNSSMFYLLIAIAAVLISVGVWAYSSGVFSDIINKDFDIESLNPSDSDAEINKEGQNDSTVDEVDEQNQNLQRAIQYINECNGVLNRDSLLLNPETEGLYEALNEFKLDELTGKWNEKFGNITVFSSIVKAASECKRKNHDPKRKGSYCTYNEDNDLNISITNWTNWVDAECSKQTDKKAASDAKKKGAVKEDANKRGNKDDNKGNRGGDW